MNIKTEELLIQIARDKINNLDPSHDICHALRVLNIVRHIARKEGGDLDILVPSALFHDAICYQKNDSRSNMSSQESAELAVDILKNIENYPAVKLDKVYTAIKECSFSRGIIPQFLEGKILQDADRLEATGIISIMRTFSSSGQMNTKFYHPEDPFCKSREPDSKQYALDLFYTRLLVVKDYIYTETAQEIAVKRTKALERFLKEFESELFDDIPEISRLCKIEY